MWKSDYNETRRKKAEVDPYLEECKNGTMDSLV